MDYVTNSGKETIFENWSWHLFCLYFKSSPHPVGDKYIKSDLLESISIFPEVF